MDRSQLDPNRRGAAAHRDGGRAWAGSASTSPSRATGWACCFPLVTTALTFAALRAGDARARRRSAALRDALAASAARNRELERLRHVAATLLASSELAALLQEISDAAVDLLEAESGGVTLVVEEGRFLKVTAVTGPLAVTRGRLVPVDGSLLGSVVTSGTPVLSNDMDADPRELQDAGLDHTLRTVAIVPLRSAGLVIGTVSVYNRRDGRPVRRPRPPAAPDPGRPGGGRARPRLGAGGEPPQRARAGRQERRAAARHPAQERVPRQHEPRAAHAAQRHHRLLRPDAHGGRRRGQPAAARVPGGGAAERTPPAGADQRRPRPLQDRGRAGCRCRWRRPICGRRSPAR